MSDFPLTLANKVLSLCTFKVVITGTRVVMTSSVVKSH